MKTRLLLLLAGCFFGACGRAPSPPTCINPLECDSRFLIDAGHPFEVDAGVDGGTSDSGVAVDAGVDAGLPCVQGLLRNGGFECGLEGWQAALGGVRLLDAGVSDGILAVELFTDGAGQARLGSAQPFVVDVATTLCVSAKVRGTAPKARLEVLRTPDNWSEGFTFPVTESWTRVPSSWLSVEMPRNSQGWIVLRTIDGSAGQSLFVDDVELTLGASGHCH